MPRFESDVDNMSDDGESVSNYSNSDKRTEPPEIAKQESRVVFGLKLAVLFVLIGSAVGAALLVYFYTSNSEETQFEEQFSEYAGKVMESIMTTMETTLGAVDILSASISAYALATNQTWPMVRVPDYAYRAAKVLPLSRGMFLAILPVVNPEDRLAWEEFVMENEELDMNETLKVMESDPNYFGPISYNCTFYHTVFSDFGDVAYNVTRPTLPNWSYYPTVCGGWYPPHNYDYLDNSEPESVYNTLEGITTLSEPYMLPDPDDPIALEETDYWAEDYAKYILPGEDPYEPVSDLYIPVFESDLSSVKVDPKTSEVVAVLTTSFYWREMFKDILPVGADGVVIVAETACAPAFTYMLNGPTVEYIGRGDLHNSKYDHLGIHSEMQNLGEFTIRASKYSGPDIDSEYCPFTFHLYPSIVLEDKYTSSDPLYFALGAIGIFIFTSLVFILYDISIERRQKLVLNTAKQSSAVVSSLFPDAVRDRMMEETSEHALSQSKRRGFNARRGNETPEMTGNESKPYAGRPIADLFPHATVFFADIAGFTSWSSTRGPEQVFLLLEALYSSFDKSARRRRVFKIETIGDCYVAVVGLPQPRKNHAMVMCRFAADCLLAASRILKELDNSLGPGTSDLSLRIGLNSGAVTAGVLRGEKGRYQLFGDTVNTASRMESNGIRNRIHVSQTTADLLVAAGKGSWLEQREDKILAKGKGEMQTYFVNMEAGAESMYGGETSMSEDLSTTEDDLQDSSESSDNDNKGKMSDTQIETICWV